jgi:cyclic pyranopterin phosphate synthase
MKRLTHVDGEGEARMVDVSAKPVVLREACASGEIRMQRATLSLIRSNRIAKGNVLATARLAGIQAAKRTGELIPLCHPLAITRVAVDFDADHAASAVQCRATIETFGRTGVEMEALTAVTLGLLTIYDMCKALDRGMYLEHVRLLEKKGGRSGHWLAPKPASGSRTEG